MTKYLNDDVLDALLNEVAEATIMTICSAAPTTRTEAITTYALADTALTPGAGNGSFTLSNGSPTGRRLTVLMQEDIAVDTGGDATHIALCDGTRLLAVTACATQELAQGNTITVNPWNVNSPDPT